MVNALPPLPFELYMAQPATIFVAGDRWTYPTLVHRAAHVSPFAAHTSSHDFGSNGSPAVGAIVLLADDEPPAPATAAPAAPPIPDVPAAPPPPPPAIGAPDAPP